jgi:NAD(P)-dependent dehydrogenase (short-subunit alcohol dehydrogenase family)
MLARRRGRILNLAGGGAATSFPNGSGYATSKAGLLRFTECVNDTLAGAGVLAFAMDPGLVRTAMTEYQLNSEAGRAYLDAIPKLFEAGVSVPPTLAARLSVEIGSGRFDKLAGRILMAARGDLDLDEAAVDAIVAGDLRSLRVNGLPPDAARAATDRSR